MITNVITGILYFYAFFLIAVHIFVVAGLLKAFRLGRKFEKSKDSVRFSAEDLKISVIVPARNEASSLPDLFDSLLKQRGKIFEIILINDRSEDRTLDIMNEFRNSHPEIVVKIINNTRVFEGKNPKQMALSLAEKEAEGDIFIYTDADCLVPETWIEQMTGPFSDPETGLVFGCVTVDPGSTFLEKFQMFDHLLRYFYTASSAAMGMPSGGFGNNLAVRREALKGIGGFESLKYTVTEDAQLIASIRDTGKWKVVPHVSEAAAVTTRAVESWKELYIQELRWSTGALHAPDVTAKAGYGAIMYQLVTGLAVIPFLFFNPYLIVCFLAGIVSMLSVMITAGFYYRKHRIFRVSTVLSMFAAQVLFPVVSVHATFRPGVVWKGSRLKAVSGN